MSSCCVLLDFIIVKKKACNSCLKFLHTSVFIFSGLVHQVMWRNYFENNKETCNSFVYISQQLRFFCMGFSSMKEVPDNYHALCHGMPCFFESLSRIASRVTQSLKMWDKPNLVLAYTALHNLPATVKTNQTIVND